MAPYEEAICGVTKGCRLRVLFQISVQKIERYELNCTNRTTIVLSMGYNHELYASNEMEVLTGGVFISFIFKLIPSRGT
jgi:hypothetical protein